MATPDHPPARTETRQLPTRPDQEFWDKYGWQTTLSVSVGVGAFGMLQFLAGLAVAPIHPIVNVFGILVLWMFAPLLFVAGVTGFVMPGVSAVRHYLVESRP